MTLVETVQELDRLYVAATTENTADAWGAYVDAYLAAKDRFDSLDHPRTPTTLHSVTDARTEASA